MLMSAGGCPICKTNPNGKDERDSKRGAKPANGVLRILFCCFSISDYIKFSSRSPSRIHVRLVYKKKSEKNDDDDYESDLIRVSHEVAIYARAFLLERASRIARYASLFTCYSPLVSFFCLQFN